MKKTLLTFVLALLVAAPLSVLNGDTARAATVNTAVRGTSATTVYWYANDGKRYVFPNAATYFTWFPSFNSVITISDAELISIPLGGNVTYRPGAKLVKINTDPRTYAVAKGGVLRHVTSESLAEQLFGFDWRSDVHDIPDVYFTNYTVGTPIYNVSDYSVSNEYNGVFSPSDSLRTTNGGTQTGDLVLNASRTSINPGEAVTLSVANTLNYGSGYRIEIYDTRTNGLVRTCSLPMSTCEITVYPQRNSTENSVQYYAALRNTNSSTIKSGYSPVIHFGNTNNTDTTLVGSRFTNTINRASVNDGEQVTFTATLNSTSNLASGYRIEIIDPRSQSVIDGDIYFTGFVLKTCTNVASCSVSTSISQYMGRTGLGFAARLRDMNGNVIATDSFPTVYITNAYGDLSLSADRTTITSGQAVLLTTTYSNHPNTSGYRTEIKDNRTGEIVKTCYNTNTCSVTVYPNQNGASNIQYYAVVKDASGNTIATQYSPVITFNGSTSGQNVLTASLNKTTIYSGETVTVTAHASNLSEPVHRIKIELYTYWTHHLIDTCYGSTTCSFQTHASKWEDGHDAFFVRLVTTDGRELARKDLPSFTFLNQTGSGDNRINGLVLNADRANINAGERVRLTANAFNTGTWSYAGNRIDIVDAHRGTIVRTCHDVSTCVADVYPQAQASTNLTAQYQARIYDRNGVHVMSQYSPVIYLTSYNGSNGNSTLGSGLITFAPTDALHPNRNVYLTSTFTGSNVALNDAQVRIYTEQSSTPIAICNGAYTCAVSYPTGSSPMTTRIYAQLSNRYSVGTYAETPRVNLTTTW